MKKLTQRELLDEGIWNTLMSPVRAVVKGAAKTLDVVAPELTKPLHSAENAVRDIGSSIKQGWLGTEGNIKANLEKQGYKVSKVVKSGKDYIAVVNEMEVREDGTEAYNPNSTRLRVDENGNTIRRSRNPNRTTQKRPNNRTA